MVKHCMDHQLQALCRLRVAAVGDVHFAIREAAGLHFQHDALQCAVLAAGLAQHFQLAALACPADDPDAQHPRHGGNGGLHAAVAGQVCQRFQREQQVGVLFVSQNFLADGVEVHAAFHQLLQPFGQQAALRPGGQAVQHKDPGFRVVGLVLLGRQQGGVVAAGQRAGDGDGEHLLRALVGGQPVGHVGAGRGGLALVITQGLGHAHGVQMAVVQIFLLVGDDLQRHTGKLHSRQLIQIG